MAPYQRGLVVDKCQKRKKTSFPSLPLFLSPFTSPPLPPSFHCKWVWSLSDVIQLISLRFNYKWKSPSYPSPLDRGSTFSNKLPLVSQESLNYGFYFSFIPLFFSLSSLSLSSLWSHQSILLFLAHVCASYSGMDCEWGAIKYITGFPPFP